MKLVKGIYLPDDDDHFEGHLERGPEYNGAGTYQFKKIEATLRMVPPERRRVALDVGAHVGLWTRILADHFEQVLAFEPVPEMIACFERNIGERENVGLCKAAVGSGSARLKIERVAGNSGNCRVATDDVEDAIGVPAFSLDDGVNGMLRKYMQVVDLIKIDVEGWELEVVRGGEQLIKRDRPILVVEQKPGNAERYGFERLAAVELLKSWGASILWEKAGDFCVGWDQ